MSAGVRSGNLHVDAAWPGGQDEATRVLHVIVGLEIGGAELMLARLVHPSHASAELKQVVVSLTRLGDVGRQLREAGVSVFTLGMRSVVDAPSAIVRLVRLVRNLRPDVVQTWMYHADLLGGVSALLGGCRRIVWGVRTTHVAYEGSHLTVVLRKICAWLSRWLPESIVCAAEASRQAHAAVGYCARKMTVIPNGFDLAALMSAASQRNAARERLGARSDEVLIGTMGRFNPVKDFGSFIRAARLIHASAPNTRFVMIGKGVDASNRQLTGWIAATGISDRFALLGERHDALHCLAAMDVFCLASLSEGFPNVVGEAMGIGVPCVVTNVGDSARLVGDTGVIVQLQDPEALAEAVLRLIALPSEVRSALGQAARQRIKDHYTVAAAQAQFVRLYRREPLVREAI